MTRVVISQPMYFPWAGFVAQLALADVLIWLDDAQFSKGSFTNRVKIGAPDAPVWMSIPLIGKGKGVVIRDLAPAQPDWRARHGSLLRNALGDAPHYADSAVCLDALDGAPTLCDAIIRGAEVLAQACGVTLPAPLRSSAMGVPGTGSDRVRDLVRAVGGTRYITGHGARNYLDHEGFEAAGIAVEYMDYAPLPWPQGGAGFNPYLSALDLVARVAPDARRAHLNPQTVGWRDFTARG